MEQDSHGKVRMGPGTLYGSIKIMLGSQLIVETSNNNYRRKFYTFTVKGKSALSAELERYNDTIKLARKANLLSNGALNQAM